MKDKIKWARLKELLETYLGEDVNIICTTEFEDNEERVIFGFVGQDNSGSYKIVLNINEVKTAENVIDVLAHESAHIITKSRKHTEEHDRYTDEIKDILKKGY